jgi:hypothetical protein
MDNDRSGNTTGDQRPPMTLGERLIASVKQARAIVRGEAEPARVHHVRVTAPKPAENSEKD